MGAGASSTKSSASNANPSINRESVLQLAQKSRDASSASLIQDLQAQARSDAARIQTLEAQVRELKSSEFSEKRHDVTQSQRDAPHTVQMDRAVAAAMKRTDEVFMRQVFERHASSRGVLSASALISALQDVDAPMLHTSSSSESLESDIFRRVDMNMNGLVDFDECEASPPADVPICTDFSLLQVHASSPAAGRFRDASGGESAFGTRQARRFSGIYRHLNVCLICR